jgi:hypothetical protein
MSGLTQEQLIALLAESTGRTPGAPPPAGSTSTAHVAAGKREVLDLPDETPMTLRRIIEQSTDNSALHQAFIMRCVALDMPDAITKALCRHYGPSVTKFADRLDAEVDRSIAKARALMEADPRIAQRIRDAEPDRLDASVYPIDLRPVLAGEVTQPEPTVLRRDDDAHLFYAGMVNGVHGDSGTGKGWVVCTAVAQQVRLGRISMVIDLEDVATSFTARLLMLGCKAEDIDRYVRYIRPQVELGDAVVAYWCELIAELDVVLVAIDSLGEAFGLEGIDENKDTEVGPWMRRVARVLAEAGPAVVLIDHATKSADNPLHPSGSKRKRAAIGGASFLVTATKPLVKGKGGRLRIVCAKDRHGNYARGETVANLVLRPVDEFYLDATLYTPTPAEESNDLPAELAARAAVAAVKAEGKPLSQSALCGAMKIKAGSEVKRQGIDLAVARGALTESVGPRNARIFTYAHDNVTPTEDAA